MSSTCADCGKTVSAGATRCRSHANAHKNRGEAMRASSSRALAARQAAGMKRNDALTSQKLKALYAADPAAKARLAAGGELGRLRQGPASQAKRSQSLTATKLAHIPAADRDTYRILAKKVGAKTAEQMLADQRQAEARRILAANENGMVERERRRQREAY